MKLNEIKDVNAELITEEFSPEFAETILNEQAKDNAVEVDVDDFITEMREIARTGKMPDEKQ